MKHQKRKKSLDPIRRPKKAELPSLFQNFHFVEIKSKKKRFFVWWLGFYGLTFPHHDPMDKSEPKKSKK